jgi:hypothetical protein
MAILAVSLIAVVGAILGYRSVRRLQRVRREYDVGTVSDDWLQKQRGKANHHD